MVEGTIGFFCRTYSKDAERLDLLMRSVERFAKGFDGITVACPAESTPSIAPVVRMYNFARLVECDRTADDFIGQQITKMKAADYADYDYICHIDSDCILTKEITPDGLFKEGRPILYMAPYEYFYARDINMPWQKVTSSFAGTEVEWEFMRQFPLTYPRDFYGAFRKWFEQTHKYPIEQIEDHIEGDYFSEFNLMGAFSYYFGGNFHSFEDVLSVQPVSWVEQFCLYQSREDRTINADEEKIIQQLLGISNVEGADIMKVGNLSASDAASDLEDQVAAGEMNEMKVFKEANLWSGGYIDADPLVPLSWSSYTTNGFVSIYHAVYLSCIKPYVKGSFTALEIGPGRGAWTRAILLSGAEKVVTLDVQSRSENDIDRFLGDLAGGLEYIQVSDISMTAVASNSIDYFWSFGTFVHFSKELQQGYLSSLFSRMKPGAHGFIQFADLDKWNYVVQNPRFMIHELLGNTVGGVEGETLKQSLELDNRIASRETVGEHVRDYEVLSPGRYFYVGADWISNTLTGAGFVVCDQDAIPSLRDPIIHFMKPKDKIQ